MGTEAKSCEGGHRWNEPTLPSDQPCFTTPTLGTNLAILIPPWDPTNTLTWEPMPYCLWWGGNRLWNLCFIPPLWEHPDTLPWKLLPWKLLWTFYSALGGTSLWNLCLWNLCVRPTPWELHLCLGNSLTLSLGNRLIKWLLGTWHSAILPQHAYEQTSTAYPLTSAFSSTLEVRSQNPSVSEAGGSPILILFLQWRRLLAGLDWPAWYTRSLSLKGVYHSLGHRLLTVATYSTDWGESPYLS